nr:HNH endonuclease signature motif containing protein [Haloechinothrix aidingensis]
MSALVQRERAIRRSRAEQDAILAEITSRGVSAEFGYPTGEALLRDTVRVDRGEARKRLARAVACYPTRAGTVDVPATAPAAGRAHRAGEIDGEHVEAIAGALGELPGEVPVVEREEGERILVELAQRSTPAVVRRAGRHLVARLDPDGQRPRDDEPARPRRELLLGWRRDGRLGFSGVLDRETGQQLQTALSPLAKPQPAADGQRDQRSTGQRHGDAFAEMIDLVLDEGKLPIEGGEKPRVILTLPLAELRDATTTTTEANAGTTGALLNHDMPVTGEQARRIACDAGILPAVLGTRGEVLDLGREQRLVSTAQRRALTLRDGGCVFPGCDRPHRWCHAHHIQHWADGGTTDLANLALLCGEHHRLIHHSDWQIHPGPHGRPYCTPPAWLARASHHDLPPPPTHAVA